jgi:hypothetical protein
MFTWQETEKILRRHLFGYAHQLTRGNKDLCFVTS